MQPDEGPARAAPAEAIELVTLPDAESVAARAATFIAECARDAIAARGRFGLAVSGGRTPWRMLRLLADARVDWQRIDLFQVDERVAPAGDGNRNLTHIADSLLSHIELPAANLHAMPVEADDLAAAAALYAGALNTAAGAHPVLDLVHLGLGPDGHTASLVPGDAVLSETKDDVAVTGVYQGHRRMTLTYPVLDRARCVLFVVTGAEKVSMLRRLRERDTSIPAGRVAAARMLIMADAAAAGNASA